MKVKMVTKRRFKFFYWLTKPALAFFIKLIWVKKITGLKNLPSKGSAIIITNHSSYMDFFILSAVIRRRVLFLATKELTRHPVIRWFLGYNDRIYVNRDSPGLRIFRKMVNSIRDGGLLIVFPEGTRSPDGRLQKTKPGFLKLAIVTKAPLIPICIKGTYEILPRHSSRLKYMKCCYVRIGRPIYTDKYIKNVKSYKHNKNMLQELSDKLMREFCAPVNFGPDKMI